MADKKAPAARAQKGTLKKLLLRVGKYWPPLLFSLLLAALTVAGTLYLPILTGRAIDCIVGPGQVDFTAVLGIARSMMLILCGTALCQWLMNLCNNRLTYDVCRDLRNEAMARLQRLPLSYLDTQPVGGILSRVIADVDQMADGLLLGFTQMFTGLLTIGGTLWFMFRVDARAALLVVCLTPLSLVVAGYIAKQTYGFFLRQSQVRGRQTALIDEMIGNQKVVQAFGREQAVLQQFDAVNEELRDCSGKATFFSSLTNPCTRFVNNMVYAAVCLAGAFLVLSGGMTVGQLSALLSYANQYTKPFNEISGVVTELQNALACAARVLELIEAAPEPPDAPDAVQVVPDGRVGMQQVSFRYVPERPLIENYSLQVKPGQRVALVGPTGCGKTTVINLLMRFYDVDAGAVTVAGRDVRNVTRQSLRAGYGMVLQETWLKSGTIRENLTMGRPDATDEEVILAAKASHAHGFIMRLPQGYNTVITEDGGSLSQGQKQLLCIARVMLCLPPMLILDEATSSIDTRTEIQIQRAFGALMQGRTSFIVAHRLSTIREADVILVMKDGRIIEQGTHESLLAAGGFYATLYHSQFEE